eukprot:s9_g13.t1
MVPTDAEPVSGARGSHEEQRPTLRPEEAEAVSEVPEEAKAVEPAEPARPAEPAQPEPVKPRVEEPEKVKGAEPEKKQDKGEPEAKPTEQADERPLQERVPLADPGPKPDGKETEEPKSKAKPAPKPGLLDKFRGFLFGQKEVVEQPSAAAATPRSPEPPEAPPEPERIPATPVDVSRKPDRRAEGLADLDSVIARMATGSNHLSLALSRSYMHMQDLVEEIRTKQEKQGNFRQVEEAPAVRTPLALPPLPPPAEPPESPREPAPDGTQEMAVQELFKGHMRSLQDQERRDLWSKSLQFDVAIVFPNPDFEENRGLSCLGKDIFSLLAGSWKNPDLAKVERGVSESEARRLYHDVLRDEKASTEAAFIKAFWDLRPWIRGKGKEENWPQSKGASKPTVEEAKRQLRCLSHGGSFRHVDISGVDD